MEIKFDKSEFYALLQISYIVDDLLIEVIDAVDEYELKDTPDSREFCNLFDHLASICRKIYASAEDYGFGHLIDVEEVLGEYVPTEEFNQMSHLANMIFEIKESVFLGLLSHRMALRDAREQMQARKADDAESQYASFEDTFASSIDEYMNEFQAFGVDNLRVERKNLH